VASAAEEIEDLRVASVAVEVEDLEVASVSVDLADAEVVSAVGVVEVCSGGDSTAVSTVSDGNTAIDEQGSGFWANTIGSLSCFELMVFTISVIL
jgi:hypothetical protein